MNKTVLVAIDIGTSGVRVEVYDTGGQLIEAGRSPLHQQTPDAWIDALRSATPAYLRRCYDCEKHVTADGTSGTFLLVGKAGEVVSGPHMYYEADEESYGLAKGLVDEEVAKRVQLNAESPIVKLFGIRRRNSTTWSRSRWVIPQATWLLYRLCGYFPDHPVTDYTNALKLGLDITAPSLTYVREAYDSLGLDLDKLPPLAPSGTPLCRASGGLASELGLTGATVYNGMTDGNASALASGALSEGEASVYTGSTTVVKVVSNKVIPHPSIYYHVHPVSGYLASAASGFTGAFLTWFSEKVIGVSVEEAIKYAEAAKGDQPVFFPPADRAPFYVSEAMASLLNLTPDPSEQRENAIGRLVRGVLVGITYMERWLLDFMESVTGVKIREVGIAGGTSRSRYWNELRRQLYGKRISVYGDSIAKGALVPVLVGEPFKMTISEVKAYFLKPIVALEPRAPGKSPSVISNYMDAWAKVIDAITSYKADRSASP
ncbi:MAG: FGGY-family carbohydrate kinase [Acidilobus sp.]